MSAATSPRYLLLPEVAEIARASLWTVRDWIGAGRLRHVKPGKRVLVREDDLIAFIESSGKLDGAATTPTVRSARGGAR